MVGVTGLEANTPKNLWVFRGPRFYPTKLSVLRGPHYRQVLRLCHFFMF